MKRAWLLLVACGSSSPARSQAPVEWTGDSLYTLVDGDVTVGVELDRPTSWVDASNDRAVTFRNADSSVEVTLGPGDAPTCALHLGDDDPARAGFAKECAALTFWRAPDPTLTWTITATPEGNVIIAATNHGTSPVRPPRDLLHLTIDGKESPDFAEAFGNGFTKGGWRALAPGATVDDARGGLALGGAGVHTLVLSLLGHEVARTTTGGPVAWTIAVTPSDFALADQASARITITATNTTRATLDPRRGQLVVLLDGASPMDLSMAYTNGARAKTWDALPPGQTVDDARVGLRLFTRPGDHVFTLVQQGQEVARTTVHVR
jgi:hypothetical protein